MENAKFHELVRPCWPLKVVYIYDGPDGKRNFLANREYFVK
jgi:hypothetical protein